MFNTTNNVHWRRGKDYFMNSVVQIPFYKDPSMLLDSCILLQHQVPHIQFMTQVSLHTISTNLRSCSASCIWMPDYLCFGSPLSERANHFPHTFQFLNTILSPTVLPLPSHSIIFHKRPPPMPKTRPCLVWLLHESRIEHYTSFVFEV